MVQYIAIDDKSLLAHFHLLLSLVPLENSLVHPIIIIIIIVLSRYEVCILYMGVGRYTH